MPRLEDVANVLLRVPSLLVLDLLYKCDIESFSHHLRASSEGMLFKYKYVLWNMYYLGTVYTPLFLLMLTGLTQTGHAAACRRCLHVVRCMSTGHFVSSVVLLLPLGHIVQLYLHVLTALLLYMGHQMSRWVTRAVTHQQVTLSQGYSLLSHSLNWQKFKNICFLQFKYISIIQHKINVLMFCFFVLFFCFLLSVSFSFRLNLLCWHAASRLGHLSYAHLHPDLQSLTHCKQTSA